MVRLTLRSADSEIQVPENQNAPNDLKMNFNSQKYPVNTKQLPPRPKFWSGSLYGILKILQILEFSIDYHVKRKKRTKKCLKSKILNFTILLTTFGETLNRSMHEFWGVNLV